MTQLRLMSTLRAIRFTSPPTFSAIALRKLSIVGGLKRQSPPRTPVLHAPTALSERTFSSSARSNAVEGDPYKAFVENFRNSPTMAKLGSSPDAMAALQELATIMKNSGVDFTVKPSMFTMMKLSSNSEFREAAKKVMAEMQKAGVDISPENAMSVFMGGGGNANSSKK